MKKLLTTNTIAMTQEVFDSLTKGNTLSNQLDQATRVRIAKYLQLPGIIPWANIVINTINVRSEFLTDENQYDPIEDSVIMNEYSEEILAIICDSTDTFNSIKAAYADFYFAPVLEDNPDLPF